MLMIMTILPLALGLLIAIMAAMKKLKTEPVRSEEGVERGRPDTFNQKSVVDFNNKFHNINNMEEKEVLK